MSTLARRQLDWVEAIDHPVIPSCEESWLIFCDYVWLQRLWVAQPALLFAVLGPETVGGRAASVSLADVHQVLVYVLDVPIMPCCRCGDQTLELVHQQCCCHLGGRQVW